MLIKARFVLKARPSTQTLVLKLTDDYKVGPSWLTQTLKYRAKSAIILNRLDEFQRLLIQSMSGVNHSASQPVEHDRGEAADVLASNPTTTSTTASQASKPSQDTSGKPTSKSKSKKKGKKK